MQEFQVNEYISLKLEEGRTKLYIMGEVFNQCRVLLLDIHMDQNDSYEEIESIDEAAEKLESSEFSGHDITPEVEFWGHCSNLQAWAENDYDTRILHRNIAFSLLRRLTDIGDPIAKRVFKEEIAKRLCSGYPPVVEFLMEEDYLRYLGFEEFEVLFNDPNFQKLESLDLSNFNLKILPNSIDNLRSLRKLILRGNSLTTLPETLYKLDSLIYLDLNHNLFSIFPEVILKITSLEFLDIGNNFLTTIPESIIDLENLEKINFKGNPTVFVPNSLLEFQYNVKLEHCKILIKLEELVSKDSQYFKIYKAKNKEIVEIDLNSSNLTEFPSILFKIKDLQKLNLSHNNITKIPDQIEVFHDLRDLNLSQNTKLRELPETFFNLTSLKTLNLSWLDLRDLSESIGNLSSLETLNLHYNWLVTLPNAIGNLKKLRILNLYGNNIRYLPDSIGKLKSLNTLELSQNLLTFIPDCLSELKSLKEIHFKNNKLTVPKWILKRNLVYSS